MDTRPCYTMEQHYCYSDFDFYKNQEGTTEVGRIMFEKIAAEAGSELWTVIDTYRMKGKWDTYIILVLQNKEGVQIETAGYGWKRVPTEHELALRTKREYSDFVDALAALKVPVGLRRWHSEIIEQFENENEEILYYGEENV